MIARLEAVAADLPSLHTGRSRDVSPFLTLEPTLVHRDDHGVVDRVGLLMIRIHKRHVGTLTQQGMQTQPEHGVPNSTCSGALELRFSGRPNGDGGPRGARIAPVPEQVDTPREFAVIRTAQPDKS
jgi:hypothetical protein